MEIKKLGDFRKLTEDLDDDFELDIRIMREVPKEELKNRSYPYPWDMYDGRMEFHDIGYSDKYFCIGIYQAKMQEGSDE